MILVQQYMRTEYRGWRPALVHAGAGGTNKRTGINAVEGDDRLLGLGVMFFKVTAAILTSFARSC